MTISPLKIEPVPEPAETDLRTDLSPEEQVRYVRWWRQYKRLRSLKWGSLVSYVILGIGNSRVNWAYSGRLAQFLILVFLVSLVWCKLMKCPRCGVEFSGGLLTLLRRTAPVEYGKFHCCYGCELSHSELRELAEHVAT